MVVRAKEVCTTLDIAKDAAGAPLTRAWLESALGLPEAPAIYDDEI